MPAPAASQAAIERALAAAMARGLVVTGFSVSRDGTVNVSTAPPAPQVDRIDQPVPPSRAIPWPNR